MEEATIPAATTFKLLDLPDACLLAVLQRLADGNDTNHRSLFSAARACSRLHAVAAEALSALQATVRNQQQADGALAYLAHAQHVTSVSLSVRWHFGAATVIRELPSQSAGQLRALSFSGPMRLQLGASDSHPGVLQVCGTSLTRLAVTDRCRLLYDSAAVTAALAALPSLQSLEISGAAASRRAGDGGLSGEAWAALSRLTHLSLGLAIADDDAAALEGIRHLAELRELRLHSSGRTVTPAVLSGLQRLTLLALTGGRLEPAALACVTQLQRLKLDSCAIVPDNPAGTAALLAQLTTLQQLTALRLDPRPTGAYPYHDIQNKAPDGSPPDVWRQLERLSESSRDAAARRGAARALAGAAALADTP